MTPLPAMAVGTAARAAGASDPKAAARLALAALLALLGLLVLLAAPLALILSDRAGQTDAGALPAAAAPFVAMYRDAATVYGVNAFLLMAVHEDETAFGTSTAPGVRAGVNFAGCCAGPMQFSIAGGGGTWAAYRGAYRRARLARPAHYPLRARSHPSVYDSFDAIYAAAAYFRALGAGSRLDARSYRALLRYKGVPPASIPFARHDFSRAKELERLAAAPVGGDGPLTLVPGNRVRVLVNGRAAVPADAPAAVKGMVAAANGISNRPYLLVHYPTHIANPTYDCSSSTSHLLWGGRRFGTAPWTSGRLMAYGVPGPGRWVSIYAHSGHVFAIVGGARFDTSRYDSGPNAGESGPRWRTGSRPMSGFVARHPEGL